MPAKQHFKPTLKAPVEPSVVTPVSHAKPLSVVHDGVALYLTVIGTQNTCCATGRELSGVGYARNPDAALAGQIYHPDTVLS